MSHTIYCWLLAKNVPMQHKTKGFVVQGHIYSISAFQMGEKTLKYKIKSHLGCDVSSYHSQYAISQKPMQVKQCYQQFKLTMFLENTIQSFFAEQC